MSGTTKVAGYVYEKGTKMGFIRMRRMGIPQPKFSLIDGIAHGVGSVYKSVLDDMAQKFVEFAVDLRLSFDDGKLVTDEKTDMQKRIDDYIQGRAERNTDDYNKLTESFRLLEQHPELASKSDVHTLAERIMLYYREHPEAASEAVNTLRSRFEAQFYEGQKQFFNSFFSDADTKTQQIFTSFSLDKQAVFNQHIEELRTLYIDNALQRIEGETNELKKAFLKKLTDYALGKTDTLDIQKIVDEMGKTSVHVAKFFARDQMSRFNKALTLSSFTAAGVKTVRWMTVGDQRVRPSHKKLHRQVFPIQELPKEVDDYNCRCGLVPEEYYE